MWLSAQEIADAALSGKMAGLPTSKRGVNMYAEREGWAKSSLARMRSGRDGGGGLEYNIKLLPAAARLGWLASYLPVDGSVDVETGRGAAIDARLIVLKIAKRFQESIGESQSAADVLFCELFGSGVVPVPDWAMEHVQGVSPRTLTRWRKGQRTGKINQMGRPKGSSILDRAEGGQVRDLILGAMVKHPLITKGDLRALVCSRYPEGVDVINDDTGEITRVEVPSVRTFERTVSEWSVTYRNVLTRIVDPDQYRSRIEVTAVNSTRADRLNELWQIDASPADVMLLVDGRAKRHSIYLAVDIYSRRTQVLVTPTPRADAVGLLIRKCLLNWGVPETIHTDNVLCAE